MTLQVRNGRISRVGAHLAHSDDNRYLQDTSGDVPPQLAEACTVFSSAKDLSSHIIYLYGGYDALSDTSQPSDTVYVLSIPSFTWIKAVVGTPTHGRNGHKCAKVYPDQMLVIGGSGPVSNTTTCLEGGAVQIFNLNTLMWQSSYDPSIWSEYKVPSVVTDVIGGRYALRLIKTLCC